MKPLSLSRAVVKNEMDKIYIKVSKHLYTCARFIPNPELYLFVVIKFGHWAMTIAKVRHRKKV